MKRFCKIAAFCLALVMAAVIACGCGAKENYDEALAAVKAGCDKFLAVDIGNIFTYKTVKVENEIEGLIWNGSEETNVKFSKDGEDHDFFLRRYVYIGAQEPTLDSYYSFEKVGDTMVELINGVGGVAQTAPEIFTDVYLDFESSDIKSAEVKNLGKGEWEYKFVMSGEFANGFDREENGAKFDCTSVVLVYYIDVMSNLSNITKEYTYTLTYEGESQTVVEFFDIKTE